MILYMKTCCSNWACDKWMYNIAYS